MINRRYIYLYECDLLPVESTFNQDLISQARKTLISRGLRFDNKTGILRDNDGILMQFVKQSEFTPYTTLEDILKWEFRGWILNSASRVIRGYSP